MPAGTPRATLVGLPQFPVRDGLRWSLWPPPVALLPVGVHLLLGGVSGGEVTGAACIQALRTQRRQEYQTLRYGTVYRIPCPSARWLSTMRWILSRTDRGFLLADSVWVPARHILHARGRTRVLRRPPQGAPRTQLKLNLAGSLYRVFPANRAQVKGTASCRQVPPVGYILSH